MQETFNNDMQRLYIEPTTLCNMDCTMCMRRTWKDEKLGHMDMDIYRKIIAEAAGIPSIQTVFFGGIGEPTFHPDFFEMVLLAHKAGKRVECVSNGTMLDYDFVHRLAENGMNQIWISVDGFSKESYEDIRQNGDFELLKENMTNIFRVRHTPAGQYLHLGLTFVAMKSNLDEMGKLMDFASRMHASDVKITHVLPYSEEAVGEALYAKILDTKAFQMQRAEVPDDLELEDYVRPAHLDFPLMDISAGTTDAIVKLLTAQSTYSIMGLPLARRTNYCKFVQEGNVFVKWDGTVTQCMALLHPSETYLHGHKRELQPYSFGDMRENTLSEIWNEADYTAFRERVRKFDFSMCTDCGSCDLVNSNQEDCIGNTTPTCGACLWAQGFIQCP